MRYATLYQVTQKRVPMDGGFLTIAECLLPPLWGSSPTEPVPEEPMYRTVRIPFERIGNPDGRDVYIAIHPDLRELLEVPILHDARIRAEQEQRQERQQLQSRLDGEVATIQRFERAPLWRRLVTAWKGKL